MLTCEYIKSFDEFRSLTNEEKDIYISALQHTYHVSLNEIAYSMKGASDNPKIFVNYLTRCGIRGDRRLGSMKLDARWAGFISGTFDIYGHRISEYGPPISKPAPPKSYPTTLEITGAPQAVLDLLSTTLRSLAINDGRKYQIGLTIQEVA